MSNETQLKRKYTRLDPSTWAEVRGLWELGDATLDELSDRYGVSVRALQAHFRKHQRSKGARAAQFAAAVQKELFDEELADKDLTAQRARDVREAAYTGCVMIEQLISAQLELAQKDAALAVRAASALKALSLAAASLERTHNLKYRALGLDKLVVEEQLPVLTLRDLTSDEIEALQAGHDNGDELDEVLSEGHGADHDASASTPDVATGWAEQDDEVVIGFDDDDDHPAGHENKQQSEQPAEQVARDAEGYRIVRRATAFSAQVASYPAAAK